MPNLSQKKTVMPEQLPEIRNQNFSEVALGYSDEQAIEEAARCLNCRNKPCVSGCPVQVDIPAFIHKIATGNFEAAADNIKEFNLMPAICGRVCPQESQCEKFCIRGNKGEPVAIGRLERFAADFWLSNVSPATKPAETNGIQVAIIGSGPAGLTCAGDLARLGYKVTIFEAFHIPGGVLVYGIPEFRLPKAIVRREIDELERLGVTINTNVIIGRTLSVDELFEQGYRAVFIGTGAGLPSFMNVPGENLNGVFSANEFLTRINLMKAYLPNSDTPLKRYNRVAVVGGGNVAMDAARCAKRLGSEEVFIVYRRGEAELPARLEEIHHAKEEGIIFKFLTAPVSIEGSDKENVCAMRCIEMELGEPDASGRRRPIPKKGSEFTLDVDCVISAIGTSPNPLIRTTTPGLEINNRGCIVVESPETGKTSRQAVYAGGDAVTGAATVILAMGAGKNAAAAINRYLSQKA